MNVLKMVVMLLFSCVKELTALVNGLERARDNYDFFLIR